MEKGLKIKDERKTVYKKYNYFLITRISVYTFLIKTKTKAFWMTEKINIINPKNNHLFCADLHFDTENPHVESSA